MDKETLSHYGWIVIVVLVLAIMLALATPFGTYVGDAVVATTKGFGSITEHNLNEDNIKNQGDKWEDKFENGVGGGTSEPESPTQPEEPSENKVPEGGTYYVGITSVDRGDYSGATATYTAGDNFPDTVNDGDRFVYGDYEYCYNKSMDGIFRWELNQSQNGWGAITITDKESYGKLEAYIAGKPVTSLKATFAMREKFSVSPEIPETVTILEDTFARTNITTAPKIPNGVTNMNGTFSECYSIQTAPEIPETVISMNRTFNDCPLLVTPPPVIPAGVKSMYATFCFCTRLTGTIEINANPTEYLDCFTGTSKPIHITGTTTLKEEFSWDGIGNITY